jgi:hypothetical protein
VKPVVISRETLKSWLWRDGIDAESAYGWLTSERYCLPSRYWITEVYAVFWADVRRRLCAGYEKSSQMCHHFAQGAAWWASICHRDTESRPENSCLLFGEMFFRPAGKPNGHALDFSYVWEDGSGALVLFEPQTSQVVTLSLAERNSCQYVRV